MSGEGKNKAALVSTPSELEFRKPNESIGLRVKEGKLTLLSRKLYNVAVFYAQRLREPGKNAPIDTPAAKKYFWFPAPDVARNASFDSKDMALLLQHFEELLSIKVHIEDDRQYTSERLLSSVKVVNPAGLKKKGGMLWIGVAFPPEVHELIMAPDSYTKLSIYYQGVLGSGPAVALYEYCRRYATNPSKVTRAHPYEYWYEILSGVPIEESPPPQYKYYKRDVIKPSIALINTITDIEVELIEEKRGMKVVSLQFRVNLKSQAGLEFAPPPVLDGALISAIMDLGISETEAGDMTVQYPSEKLRGTIKAVKERKANTNLQPITSEAAYFRWVLRNQATKAAALPTPPASEPAKPKTRPVMERFLNARARDAFALFIELNEAQQADFVAEFKGSPYGRRARITKTLDTPSARQAIGEWYAVKLWGEPTAEALAAFVEMQAQAAPY